MNEHRLKLQFPLAHALSCPLLCPRTPIGKACLLQQAQQTDQLKYFNLAMGATEKGFPHQFLLFLFNFDPYLLFFKLLFSLFFYGPIIYCSLKGSIFAIFPRIKSKDLLPLSVETRLHWIADVSMPQSCDCFALRMDDGTFSIKLWHWSALHNGLFHVVKNFIGGKPVLAKRGQFELQWTYFVLFPNMGMSVARFVWCQSCWRHEFWCMMVTSAYI